MSSSMSTRCSNSPARRRPASRTRCRRRSPRRTRRCATYLVVSGDRHPRSRGRRQDRALAGHGEASASRSTERRRPQPGSKRHATRRFVPTAGAVRFALSTAHRRFHTSVATARSVARRRAAAATRSISAATRARCACADEGRRRLPRAHPRARRRACAHQHGRAPLLPPLRQRAVAVQPRAARAGAPVRVGDRHAAAGAARAHAPDARVQAPWVEVEAKPERQTVRRLSRRVARRLARAAPAAAGLSAGGAAACARLAAMNLPTQARVVIVGGGIAGCSTAYHLAKLGISDVLLLEQGKLTSGTTWHAAGLVGQMRPNRNMTRMSKYGIELYATLEAETGLATGWKQCGSVNVARTPERWKVLQQAGGAGAQLRRRGAADHAAASRRPVPAAAHRRPAGRALDPRRRQGQPGRPVHVAGQGRAQPRRQAASKASRSPA